MQSGNLAPLILTLDNASRPIAWINWQEAAALYVRDQISWGASESSFRIHGGICQKTGRASF